MLIEQVIHCVYQYSIYEVSQWITLLLIEQKEPSTGSQTVATVPVKYGMHIQYVSNRDMHTVY